MAVEMIAAVASSHASSSGASSVYLILIACVGLGLWALVDVIIRPKQDFQAAGKSKALWVVLLVVGFLFAGLLAGLFAIIYLATVRPKVRGASLPVGR
jgi:hypothetical protein